MRLRTLPVSVAGVFTAVGFNILDGTFRALPALLCLLFALMCQIASNFANEYYDFKAGRDKAGRSGPRRGVTEGDITPRQMKAATFGLLVAACAVGLCLTLWGGLWLIAAGAAIAVGVTAYSAGPYPLSTHGLGEVAVVFFFGVVPVNLTYYVQALAWSGEVALWSVAIGLMGANVLIVNNYRDMEDDAAVGKTTLAVRFGRKAMLWLYAADAAAAAGLTAPFWAATFSEWALAVPAVYLMLALYAVGRLKVLRGARLNPWLGRTSVLMFAYSAVFLAAAVFSLC